MERLVRNILITVGIMSILACNWLVYYPRFNVKDVPEQIHDGDSRVKVHTIQSTVADEYDVGENMRKDVKPNKEPSQSSPANVFNIYQSHIHDTSLCMRTKTLTGFTICTYKPKEDNIISGSLHFNGRWEDHITRLLQYQLNPNTRTTFIDIGANIGYFSLLAASLGQFVIAIEPWKIHIEKFAHSIRLNKFEKNITVVNNAVSNDRRSVIIDVNVLNNLGGVRILSDTENVTSTKTITVKSILLNDISNFIQTSDVVIKLDIEGHECKALEMSADVFDKHNILLITMEWLCLRKMRYLPGIACPDTKIEEMLDMLTNRGFVPYDYNHRQIDPKFYKTWTHVDIYWKPKAIRQ